MFQLTAQIRKTLIQFTKFYTLVVENYTFDRKMKKNYNKN